MADLRAKSSFEFASKFTINFCFRLSFHAEHVSGFLDGLIPCILHMTRIIEKDKSRAQRGQQTDKLFKQRQKQAQGEFSVV